MKKKNSGDLLLMILIFTVIFWGKEEDLHV